jgi:DNA-binding response OmpR family regulator
MAMSRSAGRYRPRVLLVEDQLLVAMHFEDMLIESGCIIIGPERAAAGALRIVRDMYFDGAILDIHLSDGQSFVVGRALQARGVPLFFVTGYNDTVLPPDLHNVPLLTKPVSTRAFEALVHDLFHQTT